MKYKKTDRYKPKTEPLGNAEQLDNDWYERGELPPVGSACEYTTYSLPYEKCTFVGINSIGSLVIEKEDGKLRFFEKHQIKLRPIKTEREKFVDTCIASISEFKSANQVFGQLFDAGFKAPE